MYFQIKEIVLWPRSTSIAPRRVRFRTGRVNVITGTSRTGKSAIIPIIDYCLGAEKCTIPVKTVRDACSWFGVIVSTEFGEKLFARREPGEQKSTGDMYVAEGTTVEPPEFIPAKNSSSDAVRRSLDELSGLTTLDFDTQGTGSGFRGRPSFRDMAAFVFQPQNVVANPDVLFYKADTYEHREKLRTIFPYVLNAVTSDVLARQHELAELQKELRRKQAELDIVREVSERWIAEIQGRIAEAKELGLISNIDESELSKDTLVEVLRQVAQLTQPEIRVTEETISDAVREHSGLQKEEAAISLELAGLRRRLVEMTTLKQSTSEYKDALQTQIDRLAIADWLRNLSDAQHECPLCGTALGRASDQLTTLYGALQDIQKSAGDFGNVPAAFDREFERVRSDIRVTTERLKAAQIRREAVEKLSRAAQKSHYDSLRVSRFLGNVEQSLEMYDRIGTNSELEAEVQGIQGRVTTLQREIADSGIRQRTRRALQSVSTYIANLMPKLDTERPHDPVSLSVDDLTLRVGGVDREDYLWEIGSGSNWLSYHIAVSLALQQYFLSTRQSPVPSFLIYDQPSQVYFPKRLASQNDMETSEPTLRDEDVVAVGKAFTAMSEVVSASGGRLQVIVLDHAPESTWGEASNITLVEEWRFGKKLVPTEWLAE